jgi:hypothetical protein
MHRLRRPANLTGTEKPDNQRVGCAGRISFTIGMSEKLPASG